MTAVLLGTGLLVGGCLLWSFIQKQNAQLFEAQHSRGRTLARSLGRAAFVPMVLEDMGRLDILADGFTDEPDVVYVSLYSDDGRLLSMRPKEAALPAHLPLNSRPEKPTEKRHRLKSREPVFDIVMPLRYTAKEGSTPELVGFVRMGLSEKRIINEMRRSIRNNVLLTFALTLSAFALGSYLIRHMTRQMQQFMEQVRLTSELKRSNKELEAFSYSVSHDLRAPLRAIDGFSQAVMEDYSGQLDNEGKNHLSRVREGCRRMGQLIDDLLNLSRISRQEMRRENVDLGILAHAIADQLAQNYPNRNVQFESIQNAPVKGDPGLLRIALENLIGNAWKFTQKTINARVLFGVQNEKSQKIFFVRDNGAGFDMAHAKHLFGAFQRLHSVSEFHGTGIGLATVQRIVQRHGGKIWAEAAVNQGATFYFTL